MSCERCGSHAINPHLHGRDGSDPSLCDVCYWRARAEYLHTALVGVVRVADRATDEFDAARAAMAMATGRANTLRRPPGKITQHWLGVALERVCAGESEADVLADYGWTSAR